MPKEAWLKLKGLLTPSRRRAVFVHLPCRKKGQFFKRLLLSLSKKGPSKAGISGLNGNVNCGFSPFFYFLSHTFGGLHWLSGSPPPLHCILYTHSILLSLQKGNRISELAYLKVATGCPIGIPTKKERQFAPPPSLSPFRMPLRRYLFMGISYLRGLSSLFESNLDSLWNFLSLLTNFHDNT